MISDEIQLLALLRAAPSTRAVAYMGEAGPLVCECDDRLRPTQVVAEIAPEGSARALLQDAHQADLAGLVEPWRKLPLRYGPMCSLWVLPEHPQAPSMPG